MRTSCPECDAAFDLDESAKAHECPSCGLRLSTEERLDDTVSMKRGPHEKVAHFELLRKVGGGNFGDVYQARDTQLDRIVAIKILRRGLADEHRREMFLREGRAAARLRHPQIVSVHEIGSDGDTCYIVSDFIEGVTLSKYMQSRPFGPREAAELCASIADAMQHAHTAGVIHRDIKPSNIMLDGRRQPYVTDFGLAKREECDATFTTEGDLLGTVPYMPPEQAGGKSHQADRRCDVYSLGVVLYELLTGGYPFRGAMESIIYQILHDEPRPPRQLNRAVPRDLETICLKALSKEPAHRYQTAAEMADDLRRFLAGEPIKARPVGRLEHAWRWARRNPTKAGSGFAILLLLAVCGAIYMDNRAMHLAHDPTLQRVRIVTDPPGARAVCVPLDPLSDEPLPDKKVKLKGVTPGEVRLPSGDYLVVVDIADHGFHEVYRRVPSADAIEAYWNVPHKDWVQLDNGMLRWPSITVPLLAGATKRMIKFEGGEYHVAANAILGWPEQARIVPAFWLDVNETTVAEYRRLTDSPTYPEKADVPLGDEDAICYVDFDSARKCAELAGKRLPTKDEYQFAATMGGTQTFPWGDDASKLTEWQFGPVRSSTFDILTTVRVFGLYSNVAEWTDSRLLPPQPNAFISPELKRQILFSHAVCGGTNDVIAGKPDPESYLRPGVSGPSFASAMADDAKRRGLGFRCARSARPRFMD